MNSGTGTPHAVLDIPAQAYHADEVADVPTLSASLACTLIRKSPAHAYTDHPKLNPAWMPPEPKKAWDIGTVVHSLLLEGTDNVYVVEGYDDWKKPAARDEALDARRRGQTPMLRKEWDQASAIVDAARDELACWEIDPSPLTDGKPERTITWTDETFGVMCRCRPDWLRDDLTVIEDVKTSSRGADPGFFARKTVPDYGYDLRAAMYLRGVKTRLGAEARWRWIVVETQPPYVVSVAEPSELMLAVGAAKLDRALEMWRDCLQTGLWPGYGRDVHVAEPAPWELRWLDNSEEFEEEAWATM